MITGYGHLDQATDFPNFDERAGFGCGRNGMRRHIVHSERIASLLAVEECGCSLSSVSGSMKKLGIDRLNVEQRLALIEEIWESIDADDSAAVQLSDAQRAELRARLAEDDASPEDVLSLEEVEASLPLSCGGK